MSLPSAIYCRLLDAENNVVTGFYENPGWSLCPMDEAMRRCLRNIEIHRPKYFPEPWVTIEVWQGGDYISFNKETREIIRDVRKWKSFDERCEAYDEQLRSLKDRPDRHREIYEARDKRD